MAKWVIFVLTLVSAGVTVVFAVFLPAEQTRAETGATITGCVLILTVAVALMAMKHPPTWLWAVYPFLATALVTVLDIVSHDASATAQVFFFFPVLYAGAQLRRFATVSTCLAAVAGEALVAFTVARGNEAITDLAFVAAALCTAGFLLMHAGERNDRLIDRLERQAAVDPLTGLMTRRVLDTAVNSALSGAGDTAGTALLLMDVDKFKTINDVHGHPAGDAVLQQLAIILMGCNRREDLVSRLGGDEIAVLLTGCPKDIAVRRAQDILNAVRAHPFDIGAVSMAGHDQPQTLSVTLSIGVAHLPMQARDLRDLYAAADAALYEAKRLGRNQVAAPDVPELTESTGEASGARNETSAAVTV